MIAIIDYGMGNLHSVSNALNKLNIEHCITNNKEEMKKADGLILPGVGAFPDCMKTLIKQDLVSILKEEVNKGKPLLGICLGMQVLFEKGYEVEEYEGLGLLSGEIVLMKDKDVKIPHMGWNRLEKFQSDTIYDSLNKDPFVYYVHSFYAQNYKEEDLIAYSNYGSIKIPGYVRKGNILGMQFHPEKSGEDGLAMLKAFASLCK